MGLIYASKGTVSDSPHPNSQFKFKLINFATWENRYLYLKMSINAVTQFRFATTLSFPGIWNQKLLYLQLRKKNSSSND